jgi:hypothetical protein
LTVSQIHLPYPRSENSSQKERQQNHHRNVRLSGMLANLRQRISPFPTGASQSVAAGNAGMVASMTQKAARNDDQIANPLQIRVVKM